LVETLDKDEMGGLTNRLKEYLGLLHRIDTGGLNAEGEVDIAILKGSILSAVRELSDSPGDYPIWLRDPTFPLTILMVSLTRRTDKNSNLGDDAFLELTRQLLRGGLGLLKNATTNLLGMKHQPNEFVPSWVILNGAKKMIGDCIDFIGGDYLGWVVSCGDTRKIVREIEGEVGRLTNALIGYGEVVDGVGSGGNFSPGVDYLSRVLVESYGEERTIDEIEEIGAEEFQKGIECLETFGRGQPRGWRDAYESFSPQNYFTPKFSPDNLIATYSSEVERIKKFLGESGVVDPDWAGGLSIMEVPPYLRSVRSAAAYSAPSPGGSGANDHGTFYIIPSMPGGSGTNSDELIKSHREFVFMTAHETYPGHHLLDGVRTSLKNKIRSRIESPLFYEGWACYGESLLFDSGYYEGSEYLDGFMLQLARRDTWRWARLLIDIGFNKSTMDVDNAVKLLQSVGRSKKRAKMEAMRIAVTPGYQLTYALGKYEFLRLRDGYMEDLGPKKFHSTILFGGEIPFRYVEGRLKADLEKG
jgi:uncharacterized protein DUF885